MKICSACGLELARESFSKKQWQLKKSRRCKECVGGGVPIPGAAAPTLPGAISGGARECGAGESNAGMLTGDNPDKADEICSICLEAFDDPKLLPCGHSFCADCLDGWHGPSKYHAAHLIKRNCPICRQRTLPSNEVLSQLHYFDEAIRTNKATKSFSITRRDETLKPLVRMGYTVKEIDDMVAEFIQSHEWLPAIVHDAIGCGDYQPVLDWLGWPVDKRRLASKSSDMGDASILHLAVAHCKTIDFPAMLLQFGTTVDPFDAMGGTPFLHQLICSTAKGTTKMHMDETAKLLFEWGASLTERGWKGPKFMRMSEIPRNVPLLQSEFGGRRCELINLNQRKDLNGQTCVVEKYIAKKNRYKVATEHTGETFLVGTDNLKRRDRTPEDPGYYITFKDGEFKRHTFATNEECQEFVRMLQLNDSVA